MGAAQKYGGASVPSALMTRCCAQAVERAAELDHVVCLLCACVPGGGRSRCRQGRSQGLGSFKADLTLPCQRALRWEITAAGGVEA